MFHGQLVQDKWVFEQLIRLGHTIPRAGYYVDVGCHDGIEISNTLLFERLGFDGICVDANEESIQACRRNRKCCAEHLLVSDKIGKSLFSVDKKKPMLSRATVSGEFGFSVPTATLTSILDAHDAPRKIDYISVDVEGMEVEVLNGFDSDKYDVTCWTIEHNGESRAGDIANWLWDRGYMVRAVEWDFFAVKDTVRLR